MTQQCDVIAGKPFIFAPAVSRAPAFRGHTEMGGAIVLLVGDA